MRKILGALVLGALLTGCASVDFQRIDGAPMDQPADKQKFQTAATICRGEMAKANLAGGGGGNFREQLDVLKGCMAQQGYEARHD